MKLAVFDIGGSFVKYGLWDGQLSQTSKFPTPASYEEMQKELTKVVKSFGSEIEGVAFSAPGAVNVEERRIDGISAVPYIHHRPIFDELAESFGLPVTIENDANCAGIAEVQIGAGRQAENAVFVVIGTGVGGAIFIDRKLYKASHLFGGEFGLMKPRGERTLSQLGTAVKAAERYSQIKDEEIDGQALFALQEAGDAVADLIVKELYDQIALGLYNIQVSIDPDTVILGGGISARPELAEELSTRLYKLLAEEGVAEIMPTVTTCEFQNDANLLGAALNFEILNQK
ncbi:ROK family protein [Enterococcus asini]|uniref:ROK family protein n=1 Tax=Enterococcus asini TaxID=57732 RepID=UPI00288DE4B3|nr:ROK family protein [Enterococcus asini]MDT2757713.1 ROK family protein [Enterococcus asini]